MDKYSAPSQLWTIGQGDPSQALSQLGFDPGKQPACVIYKTITSNGNIQYELWFLGTDSAFRARFLARMEAAGYQFDTSINPDPVTHPESGWSNFAKSTNPTLTGVITWGDQTDVDSTAIYMYF